MGSTFSARGKAPPKRGIKRTTASSEPYLTAPKATVDATITINGRETNLAGWEFEDFRRGFKEEHGREPTLEEAYADKLAGNLGLPDGSEVTIHKLGTFTKTKCSVLDRLDASYMVEGKPMSQKAMLAEIDKGGNPEVRPLTGDEQGSWELFDLTATAVIVADQDGDEADNKPARKTDEVDDEEDDDRD